MYRKTLVEVKNAVFGAPKCTGCEFSAKIRSALMYGRPCFFRVIPTYEPLPWFMIYIILSLLKVVVWFDFLLVVLRIICRYVYLSGCFFLS